MYVASKQPMPDVIENILRIDLRKRWFRFFAAAQGLQRTGYRRFRVLANPYNSCDGSVRMILT